MWLSVVEVEEMVFQEPKLLLPFFCWYSHFVSVPLPVTEDASVSSPLAVPAVAVGFAGLPGLVRNADAAASSVEQPLSLYALNV